MKIYILWLTIPPLSSEKAKLSKFDWFVWFRQSMKCSTDHLATAALIFIKFFSTGVEFFPASVNFYSHLWRFSPTFLMRMCFTVHIYTLAFLLRRRHSSSSIPQVQKLFLHQWNFLTSEDFFPIFLLRKCFTVYIYTLATLLRRHRFSSFYSTGHSR